jgi:hypothetical protein
MFVSLVESFVRHVKFFVKPKFLNKKVKKGKVFRPCPFRLKLSESILLDLYRIAFRIEESN